MNKNLFLLVILLWSVQVVFSQTVEKNGKNGISDDLKKEATVLLRETAIEVNGLHTLENRIGLSSELASLMWFSDEKEARAMFQNVIGDFRQLLADYESQINSRRPNAEESGEYSPLSGSASQPERKFAQAIAVRQQIAKAIAEHDPQFAFEFFSDTGAAITNPIFRQRLESSDAYLEACLLNQIAEKNVETALTYGRRTLAKGFNYQLLPLLEKIYKKDPEKGAAFGEEIVSKLKSAVSKPDTFYYLTQVLDVGLKNLDAIKGKPDQRPMFSEQTLRDLAEAAAQELLKREDAENYEISSYLENIEKVLPARAAQIRRKFEIKQKVKNIPASGTASAAVTTAAVNPDSVGRGNSSADRLQTDQKQLAENYKNLGSQKSSGEERAKVVEQSRKIIAQLPKREQKILALTALAVQVTQLGDRELAAELMNEVRAFVDPQPKNYRDYMELWMLAGGYAQVDAPKAFPILEAAIFRMNDTIAAFIKVGEFIDVSGDIIDDGEIQIGGFGGEMTSGMLRELGVADPTIRSLAIADFARTKQLTGKFDRTEVRILAKMLVLRGIFAGAAKAKGDLD